MRKIFLALLALALAAGCTQQASEGPPPQVGPRACWSLDKCIRLEIVSTPEAMQRGLMFRESLPAGQGMLFEFPENRHPVIWMKNMRFPIDILWLDPAGKIVWVQENAPPCGQEPCETYSAREPAYYVLEVPAGYAKENHLETGKKLEIPPTSG